MVTSIILAYEAAQSVLVRLHVARGIAVNSFCFRRSCWVGFPGAAVGAGALPARRRPAGTLQLSK